MFPISRVESDGNSFDEDVAISKAGLVAVSGELGISWAFDLDGSLRCHCCRFLCELSLRSAT